MMRILGGSLKNRALKGPKGLETRPTTSRLRQSVFDICQGTIAGSRFLDLFAGSGAMGLEAISRGAGQAVFIDSSRDALKCLKQNIVDLKTSDHTWVIGGDVYQMIQMLQDRGEQFDIIYADPPYHKGDPKSEGHLLKVITQLDSSSLLVDGGQLFFEDSLKLLDEEMQWNTLQLKSSRKCGKAILRQYIKTL